MQKKTWKEFVKGKEGKIEMIQVIDRGISCTSRKQKKKTNNEERNSRKEKSLPSKGAVPGKLPEKKIPEKKIPGKKIPEKK